MTAFLVLMVVALVVIAAATLIGPKLGVAAPLLLVAIGVVASFIPAFAHVEIEPDIILEGILPPLLYSAAVSVPPMNFRREFGAISGLSVLLVVLTSLVLGVVFTWLIPGLSFPWAVALGAVISPTDAVATSIVKRAPASSRVIALLDGESLLNDASALVLLRTAIAATAAAFSFWNAVGIFAYSVAIAIVVGYLVGRLNLALRQRISDPTVNTVLSFTVPFLASVPVEALGGSGLVAAVVAGLVTGVRAPRELSPQTRMSDAQNWRMVELVLEGAVFLMMGIQLLPIVVELEGESGATWVALVIAVIALVVTVLVRAAYVGPLLVLLARRAKKFQRMQDRVLSMQERIAADGDGGLTEMDRLHSRSGRTRRPAGRRSEAEVSDRFTTRITRAVADIKYFLRAPLGWREGTAVVWAGMRGAITVAAAQTLPEETPMRATLIFIAFTVAALSLLVQGGTLGPLLRRIARPVDQEAEEAEAREERKELFMLLREAGQQVPEPPKIDGTPSEVHYLQSRNHRIEVIKAQREALLTARDNGVCSAETLELMLANLDADQIAAELRPGEH